jgi:uncharacterized membrane protein YqjE
MEESQHTHRGLWASVRRVTDTCFSTVQNRVELFAVELQEEQQWLIATLLWVGAAIFFCALAIIMITAMIILLCPEPALPYVLGGLCLVYIWLAVNAVFGLKRQLKEKAPAMSETIAELKKDLAWLRSRH